MKPNHRSTFNKFNNFLRNKIHWLVIVAILSLILSPIIFTQNWTNISFNKTGQIGDTIGGITAPVIGLISILLLYLAFIEQSIATEKQNEAIIAQNDAIELQREMFVKERDYDIVTNSINEIKNSVNLLRLEIKITENIDAIYGTEALMTFFTVIRDNQPFVVNIKNNSFITFIANLNGIFHSATNTLLKIEASSIDKNDKRLFFNSLVYYGGLLVTATDIDKYLSEKPFLDKNPSMNEMLVSLSKKSHELNKLLANIERNIS